MSQERSSDELKAQMREIYDQIPPELPELEENPAIIQQIKNAIREGQKEGALYASLYTRESWQAAMDEGERRQNSELLSTLKTRLENLLRGHSGLTTEAIEIVLLQFSDDFVEGRRLGDPIYSIDEVRFSTYLLFDRHNPESRCVFDSDPNLVRDIERKMLGAYRNWCNINAVPGQIGWIVYSKERSKLEAWERAFFDR